MSHCRGSRESGYHNVSLSSCAWLSVLKPVEYHSALYHLNLHRTTPTFIAIHEGVLDHYRLPIDSCILLCFPSVLAHIWRILPSRSRSMGGWYSQDMAAQKLLRPSKI